MAEDPIAEITILGELIAKLQILYEQYFSGSLNREPLDIVRQAEDIIRAYSRNPIQNPVLRFRFNNFVARYNAFRNVWDRRRKKVEGAAVKSYGLKNQKEADPDRFVYVMSEERPPEKRLSEIFKQYIDLRRKCNEPVDKIRFENFKAVLTEQIAKMKQKSGAAAVVLSLEILDKKSKISAKPFKD